MSLNLPGRRIATAAFSVAVVAGFVVPQASAAPAAPAAVSQLPGAFTDGTVVVTDSPHVSVKVEPHDGAGDKVTVTVTNHYDHKFRCAAPTVQKNKDNQKEGPNVVTTAEIVSKSVNYYRSAPFIPRDAFHVPILGEIPLEGLLRFVPQGSLSRPLGADITSRAELFRLWDQARRAGHTGEIEPFDLDPMGNKPFTVELDAPANGKRTDFPAAALLYCTDTTNQAAYVFAGYEPVAAPPKPHGSIPSAMRIPGVLGSSR